MKLSVMQLPAPNSHSVLACSDVGVIYYHITTVPHPKFLLRFWRSLAIKDHAIRSAATATVATPTPAALSPARARLCHMPLTSVQRGANLTLAFIVRTEGTRLTPVYCDQWCDRDLHGPMRPVL